MKRCPQCSFIYLDEDEFCDLDGAVLSYAEDRDLERTTLTSKKFAIPHVPSKAGRMIVTLIAALALLLGVTLFFVCYQIGRAVFQTASIPQFEQQAKPETDHGSNFTPTPAPLESPSPSPKPTATARTASTRTEPNRPAISRSAVSTTADPGPRDGHAVIRLTDGASVEADEVWRTRDGFWYRRKGVVTLIKPNRVKQVERIRPKQ